jgi:hypothetical protein
MRNISVIHKVVALNLWEPALDALDALGVVFVRLAQGVQVISKGLIGSIVL